MRSSLLLFELLTDPDEERLSEDEADRMADEIYEKRKSQARWRKALSGGGYDGPRALTPPILIPVRWVRPRSKPRIRATYKGP